MFPLGNVLVPHALLPLHLFEERYRAMIRDVLGGDREFGVVLIDRGRLENVSGSDVTRALEEALQTMSVRDAADYVAQMLGVKKRPVYQEAMMLAKELRE